MDWRAWLRSVGAEYAAIPRSGFKPFAAAHAVIEELAGVSGHQLASLTATLGTGDRGLRNHAPRIAWSGIVNRPNSNLRRYRKFGGRPAGFRRAP